MQIQLTTPDYPQGHFKTATLAGKRIIFTPETEFYVQVGRKRGAYDTVYTVTGNIAQAIMLYNGINTRWPYKKRLFCPTFNRPILAAHRPQPES